MSPSFEHEAALRLFRNRPQLAPELIRDALHEALPAYSEVRIESADLTDLSPAEYRADLVVLLVDGEPILGIVIEVQLQRDERKRFTWPVYVAGLRARLSCPTCLLVVTPDALVEAWSRAPIEIGPGWVSTPFVAGPSSIPFIVDTELARRDPELALLSVMAHGHEPHAEGIALAALAAAHELESDKQVLYSDIVFKSLSPAVAAALEDLMASGNYEFQSDFAKKHQAVGRAEGIAEGKAEGIAEGKADALVTLLVARGLAPTASQRESIASCRDLAQLDDWFRKAIVATSLEEIFGGA